MGVATLYKPQFSTTQLIRFEKFCENVGHVVNSPLRREPFLQQRLCEQDNVEARLGVALRLATIVASPSLPLDCGQTCSTLVEIFTVCDSSDLFRDSCSITSKVIPVVKRDESWETPHPPVKVCLKSAKTRIPLHVGGAQEHSELERKLQSDLAYIKRAFSTLSASNNGQQHSIPQSTLEKVFKLAPLNVDDKASSHDESALSLFISEIGPAITRTFFNNDSGQVDWPLFLSGFDMCCKQGLGAVKLKLLFAVFVKGKHEHELLPGLQVEGDQDLSGFITTSQLQDVFLLCWLLMCDSRLKNVQDDKELHVTLPNLHPLLASCYLATSEAPPDTVWKGKEEISVEKATSWILATIPGISDCFSQYIRTHLQRLASHVEESNKPEDKATLQETEAADKTNLLSNSENAEVVAPGLLTLGTAWAIGLSQRDSSGSDLVSAACDLWSSSNSYPTLLYRASSHGRGLSRFWTRVEGYRAPLLMLMSGTSTEDDGEPRGEKWAIGALIPGGFENKGVFYGNSGCCLFAISPHFLPLRSSGRETNYVYSYKRTPGTIYSTHPKPEGVGFGGSQGKERLWLDDEFLNVTIQHHALDKSYHPGSLVPGQGYGAVKGRVGEVEVWGLGGLSADQQQAQYQHRENMFSEQRRKVDLKNFGNWKDSPEAAMMDMVSHPNQPAKEER